MLRHWYKPTFWSWWWGNVASTTLKATMVVVVCALAAAGGYLAALSLSSAQAADVVLRIHTIRGSVRSVTVVRPVSVTRISTVRENGHLVRKLVPVVHLVTETTTSTASPHTVTVPVTTSKVV